MNGNYKVCQSVDDVKLAISTENNSFDVRIESELPEVTKTEKCILGIDEAGRGPVLGTKTIKLSLSITITKFLEIIGVKPLSI